MCDIPSVLAGYLDRHNIDELARKMGMAKPTLYRKLNPYDEYDVRAREIIPLIEHTQDFSVLDAIETHFGRTCIRTVRLSGKVNMRDFCEFAELAGKTISELSASLVDDNHLNTAEAKRCLPLMMELARLCAEQAQKCHAVMEGANKP